MEDEVTTCACGETCSGNLDYDGEVVCFDCYTIMCNGGEIPKWMNQPPPPPIRPVYEPHPRRRKKVSPAPERHCVTCGCYRHPRRGGPHKRCDVCRFRPDLWKEENIRTHTEQVLAALSKFPKGVSRKEWLKIGKELYPEATDHVVAQRLANAINLDGHVFRTVEVHRATEISVYAHVMFRDKAPQAPHLLLKRLHGE